MPWYQEAKKDVGSCEKLRGAATQALIRRFPNGATSPVTAGGGRAEYIGALEPTRGTETSQYLEEKKTTVIPLVAVSERGPA